MAEIIVENNSHLLPLNTKVECYNFDTLFLTDEKDAKKSNRYKNDNEEYE
jgi:hypothetical protein